MSIPAFDLCEKVEFFDSKNNNFFYGLFEAVKKKKSSLNKNSCKPRTKEVFLMSSPNPLPFLLGIGSVIFILGLLLVFVLWVYKLRKRVEPNSALAIAFPLLGAGVVGSLLLGFGSTVLQLLKIFHAMDVVSPDKKSTLLAKFLPAAIKPAQYGFLFSLVLVAVIIALALNLPKNKSTS
jgi:hypothetical protein